MKAIQIHEDEVNLLLRRDGQQIDRPPCPLILKHQPGSLSSVTYSNIVNDASRFWTWKEI